MRNPFISPKISVRLKDGTNRVFADSRFDIGDIIEACSFIPVTKKAIASLEKNMCFDLATSFFINPEEVYKERTRLDEIKNRIEEAQISGLNESQLRDFIISTMTKLPIEHFQVGSILTGFGSMYRKGDEPNVNWSYQPAEKLYIFKAVRTILQGEELVIPKLL